MSLTVFYTFGQIVFGGLWLTPLIPFELFGANFFRVNGMMYFLMLGMACSYLPAPEAGQTARWIEFASFHGAMVLVGVYTLALFIRPGRAFNGLVWAAAALGTLAMLAGGPACAFDVAPAWQRGILSLEFLTSAWVTGGALLGMMVGHWYLMKPLLPFEPLIRVSRCFAAGTVFSLVFWTASQIAIAIAMPAETAALSIAWSPRDVPDLLVLMRPLVGIIVPVGLGYMILESSRLRANMSATGLFYVVFALALAGDLVARALLISRGLVL